ncbi:MAG: hypothetical protein L3K14_07720 [Thermoplasmata archaeon]|nr:hypothetical protein [Thermoplasmata archaeon]
MVGKSTAEAGGEASEVQFPLVPARSKIRFGSVGPSTPEKNRSAIPYERA